jgi:hypothetical protein
VGGGGVAQQRDRRWQSSLDVEVGRGSDRQEQVAEDRGGGGGKCEEEEHGQGGARYKYILVECPIHCCRFFRDLRKTNITKITYKTKENN